jgi:CheY-like chemotaxis protein
VRLAQVLGNLIHNAAKYTPARGHIAISATRRDGEAIVTVKDTGVGIAPEMLPRIFALFEQAASSLDRAEGGLGIGLTLARRLAEAHGGALSARSDGLGCGSEFELRLPAAAPPLAAPPPSVPVMAPSRRILVVDDNPDVAETMAEVLRLDGHVVAVAADGLEALTAVDAFSPTVLLVDIGLPHLDGFELARRLRQREDGARLLLVAVTGYGQAADQRRCLEAGFDHHLTKPVALDVLNRVLAAPRP